MAIHSYLNIPLNIADKIETKEEVCYKNNYRFLYQKGDPLPTDFVPTFMDDKQEEIRERRKLCGDPAYVVVSQHKKKSLGDYAVSLFLDLETAKKCLWKNDSYKKDYPAIAIGSTNQRKGYAINDKDCHVSYFLFDYVTNSPYNDFRTIEEADIDE